jgi:hypothetical protein
MAESKNTNVKDIQEINKKTKTKTITKKCKTIISEQPDNNPDNLKADDLKPDDVKVDYLTLDKILNSNLVSLDNKYQSSMFFIAFKSIEAINKELINKYNTRIPQELFHRAVTEIAPNIIRDYTNNLNKKSNKSRNNIGDVLCAARKLDGKQCTRKKYNSNDFCKSHMLKLPNGRIDEGEINIFSNDVNINKDKVKDQTDSKETQINKSDNFDISNEYGKLDKIVNTNVNNSDNKKLKNNNKSKNIDNTNNNIAPGSTNIEIIDSVEPDNILEKISKRGRKSKVPFDPRQYDNEYVTLWEDIVEGEKVLVDNQNNVYTFDLQSPVYIGKKDVNIKLDVRKFIDNLAKN